MGCACRYGYEDCDEYSAIWRESRVAKTRKPHRCYECGDAIPAGSSCCAAFWAGGSSGGPVTAYRCFACAALAELVAEINKACPLWGGLRESAQYTPGVDWDEWRARMKAFDHA